MWRKSSFCASGECLEWRTSTYSNGTECVETAADTSVQVRDSTDPDGAVLAFSPAAWREFTRTVRDD